MLRWALHVLSWIDWEGYQMLSWAHIDFSQGVKIKFRATVYDETELHTHTHKSNFDLWWDDIVKRWKYFLTTECKKNETKISTAWRWLSRLEWCTGLFQIPYYSETHTLLRRIDLYWSAMIGNDLYWATFWINSWNLIFIDPHLVVPSC